MNYYSPFHFRICMARNFVIFIFVFRLYYIEGNPVPIPGGNSNSLTMLFSDGSSLKDIQNKIRIDQQFGDNLSSFASNIQDAPEGCRDLIPESYCMGIVADGDCEHNVPGIRAIYLQQCKRTCNACDNEDERKNTDLMDFINKRNNRFMEMNSVKIKQTNKRDDKEKSGCRDLIPKYCMRILLERHCDHKIGAIRSSYRRKCKRSCGGCSKHYTAASNTENIITDGTDTNNDVDPQVGYEDLGNVASRTHLPKFKILF